MFIVHACSIMCCLLSAPADAGGGATSPFWKASYAAGAVTSVAYDPSGSGVYGSGLLFQPLVCRDATTGAPFSFEPPAFEADGKTLVLRVAGTPADGATLLGWPLDLAPEGHYDRLTNTTRNAAQEDNPAFMSFMSGSSGNTLVIEGFKRVDPEQLNAGMLHHSGLRNTEGNTTIISTRDGAAFRLTHSAVRGTIFRYENGKFLACFFAEDGVFRLTAQTTVEARQLDGGGALPSFSFGNDIPMENSLGGKTSLNRLLGEFCQQAGFWYPSGHGISAWAAWGPMGHAFTDTPYRIDSRNSVAGQIICDDGFGHDGLAYAWGDTPGWPFPGGYDTRHFGINAMHIVGMRTYLLWTGERDVAQGGDFAMRVLRQGQEVLAQNKTERPEPLRKGYNYTQPFTASTPFDTIALHLQSPSVDPASDETGLADRINLALPNPAPDKLHPQALRDVAGQCLAQRIRPTALFDTVGARLCNWANAGQGLRMRVFAWTGDYQTSIAANPLGERIITEVKDNFHKFVTLTTPQPGGAEVLLVCDMPTPEKSQTGVWILPMDVPAESGGLYVNGVEDRKLSMQMSAAHRVWPGLRLTLHNAGGAVVWSTEKTIPAMMGEWTCPMGSEISAGDYILSVEPLTPGMHWRLSIGASSLGGRAACNGFTWNWMERARREMAYQLDILNGTREKLLNLDGKAGDLDHLGLNGKSVGNGYYDILPFGFFDAYSNAWFVSSLTAMADMERTLGDPSEAARYEAFAIEARARYNELFWTDKGHRDGAARYIGCVDSEGGRHDYGFTFVNTLALDVGLASPKQAEAVLSWLDTGVSIGPDGKSRPDIYHFGFAPRCTTIDNPDWWAVQQRYESYPFGTQIQNGGADLYETYYDIMARLKTRGPDDAYARLMGLLKRYAEPDRLAGGSPLYTGETVQGYNVPGGGATGVMSSEFPETSLLAAIVLYGFLGADAQPQGLRITPKLPAEQTSVTAGDILYHGARFHFTATRDSIHITCAPRNGNRSFNIAGNHLTPPFEVDASLDKDAGLTIVPVE